MTLAFICAVIGAAMGAMRARRAKGNRLDILQYAVIFGIAGGLLGFMVSIVLVRTL